MQSGWRTASYIHHQIYLDDAGNRLLWNIVKYVPEYTASHIIIQKFLMVLRRSILSITIAETTKSKFKRRATSKLKTYLEVLKRKPWECRKLLDEEIGNLYYSHNIMRLMKPNRWDRWRKDIFRRLIRTCSQVIDCISIKWNWESQTKHVDDQIQFQHYDVPY